LHDKSLIAIPILGVGEGQPDAERRHRSQSGSNDQTRLARVKGLLRSDIPRDQVDANGLRQDETSGFADDLGNLIFSPLELLGINPGSGRNDRRGIEDFDRQA
jgi:hypothetical protein